MGGVHARWTSQWEEESQSDEMGFWWLVKADSAAGFHTDVSSQLIFSRCFFFFFLISKYLFSLVAAIGNQRIFRLLPGRPLCIYDLWWLLFDMNDVPGPLPSLPLFSLPLSHVPLHLIPLPELLFLLLINRGPPLFIGKNAFNFKIWV